MEVEGEGMARFSFVVAAPIKPVLGASGMSWTQLERAASSAGLPEKIVWDASGIIPLHAAEKFLSIIQQKLGDPGFLFRSLELDPDERQETHSVAGIPLPTGLTPVEALNQMTGTLNSFISGTQFFCTVQGDRVWVGRTTGATEWSDKWPALQYNLGIMRLANMRLLSPDLQPAELALPIIPPRDQIPDELSSIPVMVSGKHFGMAFKLADILSRPFPLGKLYKKHPDHQTDPIGTDQFGTIARCISGFLASSAPNRLSELVAKAFGMSARTYRRHLAEMGTTHAHLLADVRLDMALGLLADDGNSVTGIAMELGYAHPGDFTRFFKARMGVSPAEFRRLRCGTELGPC